MNGLPLYSFDVFDTLLVRCWSRPADLFLRVGERLKERGDTMVRSLTWQRVRLLAERRARRATPVDEVTLEQIYGELALLLSWSARQSSQAMELEIAIEAESLRPVPAALRALNAARAGGHPIAFLSDMYLPSEVIRGWLERFGMFQSGDLLLVSGQAGCSKAGGGLFRQLADLAGIDTEDIVHHGDNPLADVEVPLGLGCRVVPQKEARLNRFETALAQAGAAGTEFHSLLAGAARLARLAAPPGLDARASLIWTVSAGVAGPLLLGYVYWVLLEAHRLGLKRLYFVSREGQILMRLAETLNAELMLPLEFRYLHGSRQAWLRPASIAEMGQRRSQEDKSSFYSRNVCHGGQQSRLAQEYFRQQGLFDREDWGMVDLGWRGNLQAALGDLLDSPQRTPLTGFYFALSRGHACRPGDRMLAYFSGRDVPLYVAWTTYGAVLELFATADHGQVCGYEKRSEEVCPLLTAPCNEPALSWGLAWQQEAIMAFSRECLSLLPAGNWRISGWRRTAAVVGRQFLQRPAFAEAAVYGDFPVAPGIDEAQHEPLAACQGRASILAALLMGTSVLTRSHWLEGSIARSLPEASFWLSLLRARRYLGYILSRLRMGT